VASEIGEDRSWMYSGWDNGGNYTDEWMDKATTFLDYAFSQSQIAIHLCKNGFVSGYKV
jgi:hypothetical protein